MKRTSFFSILLLIVLSGGCNNTYTVKTTINADGSIEKIIVCAGDSLGIYTSTLPFAFSDGWQVTIRKDTGSSGKFIGTATKKFGANEQLQAELVKGGDSAKLKIVSRIEKRFAWFFSYYTYRETIPAYGVFKQAVPIGSAFTPDEIDTLKSGREGGLKDRIEKYWLNNIAEEFVDTLIVRSQALNDPALARSRWSAHRKFITASLVESDLKKGEDISTLIARTFAAPSAMKLRSAIDTSYAELLKKVELENSLDHSYLNEVVMPGMLITSNAKKVEGNTVTWTCSPQKYFDVEMVAESRMVNLWAVILTVVVCMTLLAGLLIPVVRLKRKNELA